MASEDHAAALPKSPCPLIAAPLASLLYPCCEAGGFYCLSCPLKQEAHLSLSPKSAHKHAQRCRPPVPPCSIFAVLFAWQHAMIEPLQFHNYRHYPSDRYQHPPLPDRATYPGWACLNCGEGFHDQAHAKAHLRYMAHQGLFSSSVMLITQRHSVPVLSSAPEHFALLTRLNATLASAMQAADSSNVSTHAVLPDVLLFGSSALSGTRNICYNNNPRPTYIQVLNWFASFDKTTAEKVTTFLLQARSPQEEALHTAVTQFFTTTVAPMAASAPVAFRALVNHAFQVGGFGHQVNLFKPCTPDTHERYAASIANAVVFAYRYSTQLREPELHSWKPSSRNDHDAVISQLKLALSTAPVRGADSGGQAPAGAVLEHLQWLAGEYFHVLFSQAASPNPAAPGAQLPSVYLQLSGLAPLLVTWLCCSLLHRSSTFSSDVTIEPSAQVCRKRAVALIFGIKAYILYRLHARATAQRPLIAPTQQAMAALIGSMGSICMPGDPAGAQLLNELSHSGTTFQLLVVVASTARYHQDGEALQVEAFTAVPSTSMAYSYRGKVLCIEALHHARVRAYDAVKQSVSKILRKAAAALPVQTSWTDPTDLREPILFGGTRESVQRLANELCVQWGAEYKSATFRDGLTKLVWELGVAIYFDLVIGPRVTEYVCLQALPLGGLPRHVSLDPNGRVVLHVSSRKNNLSDLAVLSPALSELVVVYLAKIRPHIAALLDDSMLPFLLPGLTAEALRRRISILFSNTNRACVEQRLHSQTGRGMLLPLQASATQDIGPQIVRQFVHLILHQLMPGDFAGELNLLRDMIDHERHHLAERLSTSVPWQLFVRIAIQPHLVGSLALHSPVTGASIYGQLQQQQGPAESQQRLLQIHAFRDFTRHFMDKCATQAAALFGMVAQVVLSRDVRLLQQLARLHSAMADESAGGGGSEATAAAAAVQPTSALPHKRTCLNAEACAVVDNVLLNRHFAVLPLSGGATAEIPMLYRSTEQQRLVHLAVSGCNTLAIMPTGSGKTMAVVSCAMASAANVSLLVLPLTALEEDMLMRLHEFLGGPESGCVRRFEHCIMHERAAYLAQIRILIVSVGDLRSPELLELARTLASMARPVSRIFLDEVHLFLPYTSFRPDFLDVGTTVQQWGVPIIALTATASPLMQKAIVRYVFGNTRQVTLLVAPCLVRTNILYDVHHHVGSNDSALPAFAELVIGNLLLDTRWKDMQFIVFAHSYQLCAAITAQLCLHLVAAALPHRVGKYHGGIDVAEKAATLKAFRDGTLHILVGTEAIGCGLDLPNVGVVLHYGIAGACVEAFVQQSGRAARPGGTVRIGLSLVFAVPAIQHAFQATIQRSAMEDAAAQHMGLPSQQEMLAQMAAYVALERPQCRRQWLAHTLDSGGATLTATMSCRQRVASLHGQALDEACCNLCAQPMGGVSHHTNQANAIQVAQVQLQISTFAEQLYSAREFLRNPSLCLECSCQAGHMVTYQQPRSGCLHRSIAQLSRCYSCAAKNKHMTAQCTVFNKCWSPESALARCFKCLELRHGHTTCTEVIVRDSFVTALALALCAPDFWDELHDTLPPLLVQKYHRRNLISGISFLDQEETCVEFFKFVVAAARAPQYCIAHEVVVHLACYLQRK